MLALIFILIVLDGYWSLKYMNPLNVKWWYLLPLAGFVVRFTIGIKKKVITRWDSTPYLIRYTIHTNSWFSIKLHRILESDDACLHDHPWAFLSIILRNGYIEETDNNNDVRRRYPIQDDTWPSRRWKKDLSDYVDLSGHLGNKFKQYRAGSILFRKANYAHRLIVPKPATTLVITFKKTRQWGFFTPGGWVKWYNYRQGENTCE